MTQYCRVIGALARIAAGISAAKQPDALPRAGTTLLLYPIHSGIGIADQSLSIVGIEGVLCDANAG